MDITKFQLSNVGSFESIEVMLAPTELDTGNVTVIVGNNGAGKTSIVKSLATSLSWLVSRIRSERGGGTAIPEEVIRNGAISAAIDISICDEPARERSVGEDLCASRFGWSIAKTRSGRKGEHKSDLTGATVLAERYRRSLSEDDTAGLPLIAFYPVERVVLDIPLKLKGKHSFLQLDGYDNALNQGVDFRRFFEWFREREDAENESGMPQEIFEELLAPLSPHDKARDKLWDKFRKIHASARDRQLTAVRTAISEFMPGFRKLAVRRKPRLRMSIDKNGETLDVAQLSQGEKSLMALVGDIARRLAMMNPALTNPLSGDGIVLIDEVDMHLHPKWQRTLIDRLTTTFPNCQFVLTTHSPLVISDNENVLTYLLADGELHRLPSLYGEDANSVLLEVMDTDVRNAEVNAQLNDLLDAIQQCRLDEARHFLAALESKLAASNTELAKARLLLRAQELRHAKD